MSYSFQTVKGASKYKPWSKWEVSDFIVGKYVSESVDTYGKPNYRLEVLEANFKAKDHPSSGDTFTLNSCASLGKAMKEIVPGEIVKVIYKGRDTMTKGPYKGKEFSVLEVLKAKDTNAQEEDSVL
jgi:hypothetical protein